MKFLTSFSRVFFVALMAFTFSGCLDNDPSATYDPYKQRDADMVTIDNYLAQQGITNVIKDPRGIRVVLNGNLGSGLTAIGTNRVKVNYTGRVLGSATPFEENKVATGNELRSYILGWQAALSVLPEGTSATVYIASPLAYQNQASGSIPANSILVFDITFVEIERTEAERSKFTADTTAINTYLTQKNIQAVKDPKGVRYVITQEGGGANPGFLNRVRAKFNYRLLSNDANVVLSQELQPTDAFYSRVADYINGLQIGLQKMTAGSKATFYIPSGLAYGPYPLIDSNGAQLIPSNSNLIVEVELQAIQ